MSLCSDQTTFNDAVYKALDDYGKKKEKVNNSQAVVMFVWVILWLACLVYGVLKALKVPDKDHRTLHLIFAITMPPVYVLATLL